MATLYVTEQGARLEKEYRRLLVTRDDKVLMAVPLARVSEVVLIGRVGATTPALLMLLDAGAPLSFLTRDGRLRGRLTTPVAGNLPLRQAQYARSRDPVFCLQVARCIVDGKLRNTRTLAYRLCRSHPELERENLSAIERAITRLPGAQNMAGLRGMEGLAARIYFGLWRRALRPEFASDRRTRRPPRDPANALLSLGYTLLTQNLMAACEVVGLDPYDGFFHADKYGRPALSLDLVEEFRGVVVDSVVQTVINRGMIAPKDFVQRGEGIYLTSGGLRRFLAAYAHRLNTEIYHPGARRRLNYQRIFEVQARLLSKLILGEIDNYSPFRIR